MRDAPRLKTNDKNTIVFYGWVASYWSFDDDETNIISSTVLNWRVYQPLIRPCRRRRRDHFGGAPGAFLIFFYFYFFSKSFHRKGPTRVLVWFQHVCKGTVASRSFESGRFRRSAYYRKTTKIKP